MTPSSSQSAKQSSTAFGLAAGVQSTASTVTLLLGIGVQWLASGAIPMIMEVPAEPMAQTISPVALHSELPRLQESTGSLHVGLLSAETCRFGFKSTSGS